MSAPAGSSYTHEKFMRGNSTSRETLPSKSWRVSGALGAGSRNRIRHVRGLASCARAAAGTRQRQKIISKSFTVGVSYRLAVIVARQKTATLQDRRQKTEDNAIELRAERHEPMAPAFSCLLSFVFCLTVFCLLLTLHSQRASGARPVQSGARRFCCSAGPVRW